MGHPIGNEHRADRVMKNRVSKITHGMSSAKAEGAPVARRAAGGAVKAAPQRADGGAVKPRADKVSRAKGGRVKSAKTNVNVIIAPGGQKPPMAGVGMLPPAAPPMPPKPPMPLANPPMAMGPAPGMGGMPPRSDGGRAYKKGGAVKGKMSGEKKHGKKAKPFKMRASGGAVDDAGIKGKTGIGDRTQIQHSGNKSDTQNIGRGPVITRATGGPIYSNGKAGAQMAWLKGKGAGGGKARLAKAARKGGHEPWTKDAAT